MKLLGAREVAEGTGIAQKGIKGVGTATRNTGRESTKASKANSVLTRSYGALGRAAKLGIGIIGIGGVFALQQAVVNTEELSKVTTGLNRNLRISTQDASRWGAVAHARGIASTQLNMAFTKLGKTFVEANRKGGTARTALNQLGITQAQTAKGSKDFNYALELVAKQFGKAKGGPERQAAAMSLLGKGYSAVLPLFSSGTKGLKEQLHWADKYGVTLDGKTNSALMDMVNAQRESKVAMLGLQVSLTKALMPAIEGGQDQLQEFIGTLNDPDLTSAQKIVRIQKQFENLEDALIQIITDALPKVAEQGGALGLKLAGAVWEGFKNSNLLGKAVIAAYLFKALGGGSLLKSMLMKRYAENGKLSGKAFTAGVLLGTVLLGYLLAEELDKKFHWREWGINASENFINGYIAGLNKLARDSSGGLFGGMNPVLEALGVDPDSPIPEVNFHTGEPKGTKHHSTLPGLQTPPGVHPFAPPGGPKHPRKGRPSPRRNLSNILPPIHVHTHIDGKEVAVAVARHANRAAARA